MIEKFILIISLVYLGIEYFAQSTSIHLPDQIADSDFNPYDEGAGSSERSGVSSMAFLGTCEGRNFYYNDVMGTQAETSSICEEFGMRQATFASLLQLQCVTLALDNSVRTAWTSASMWFETSSFQSGGAYLDRSLRPSPMPEQIFSLLLINNNTAPRLASTLYTTLSGSICTRYNL